MYTLRYTYENSMVVTIYLLDNSNGENVKVYCKIKICTWYNSAIGHPCIQTELFVSHWCGFFRVTSMQLIVCICDQAFCS